jgi:hypothetical protein
MVSLVSFVRSLFSVCVHGDRRLVVVLRVVRQNVCREHLRDVGCSTQRKCDVSFKSSVSVALFKYSKCAITICVM